MTDFVALEALVMHGSGTAPRAMTDPTRVLSPRTDAR